MPVDEKYPAGISPVVSLAEDYKRDLDILRTFNPVTIIPEDISKLRKMCNKYGMDYSYSDKIDKDNFFEFAGILSNMILRLYQQLTSDILDREREQSPEKKPRDHKQQQTRGDINEMYK